MNPEPLEWWRWVLLVLFFGGLFGMLYWVKRGPAKFEALLRKSCQRLSVHETRWLAPRTSVTLIEVDGEHFLLAQNPGALAWMKLSGGEPSASPHRNGLDPEKKSSEAG